MKNKCKTCNNKSLLFAANAKVYAEESEFYAKKAKMLAEVSADCTIKSKEYAEACECNKMRGG